MKIVLKTVLKTILLLLIACSVSERVAAQTFVQAVSQGVVDPKISYTLTFPKPNTAPCTLIASVRGFSFNFTDSNGNTWVKVPGHNNLWYTTSCASGANAVTVPFAQPSYFQAVIAEYSGVLVPDQISDLVDGSGVPTTSPFIQAKVSELLIGSGWNEGSNFDTITSTLGFTQRGDARGVNVFLQDSIQAADGQAVSSATYAFLDSFGWHHAIAAFKVSVPPPPPPAPVSVFLAGTLLWDDSTPVQGKIQVQQQIGANSFQVLTDLIPDLNGIVLGTAVVDMTQPDPATFKFILLDTNGNAVAVMQQAVPKSTFQIVHGVNNFKIIISKTNFTLSAGTDVGVLAQ